MLLFLLHLQLKNIFSTCLKTERSRALLQLHSFELLHTGAKNDKNLGLKLALKHFIFLTFSSAECEQVSGKQNNRDKTNTSSAESAAQSKENSLY